MEANNSNNKALELAKKLKALADRGVGGEASNAQRLLNALLAKHNIKLDDLERPEKHRCEYNIMLKHQELFWSLVFNVVQNYDGKYWKRRNSNKVIILELTYAEQLELTAKFDHYVRHYDKQLKLFAAAFVVKHQLYPNRTEDFDASSVTSKNKRSFAEMLELESLASGITRNDFKTRLEDMSRLLPEI